MRLRRLPAIAIVALLAACGGTPMSAEERARHVQAAREPAEMQVGDLRIRASIAPTAALGDIVAQQYGVRPDPDAVLLLVGVRRVEGADEVSIPAGVVATVRDLRGVQRPVALREVRNEGFIDYAGTVRIAPPDTLTFDVAVEVDGNDAATLRFSRDVFP